MALLGLFLFISAITLAVDERLARPVEPYDVLCVTGKGLESGRLVVVGLNGAGSFPELGSVRVAGTIGEALLSKLNRAYLRHGFSFTVSFADAVRTNIQFRGAVNQSGSCPYRTRLRVADIAALAEPTFTADLDRIQVIGVNGQSRTVSLRIGRDGNPELEPGDLVVFVPSVVSREVSVLGEVATPGTVDWVERMTAKRAIGLAGGASGSADLSKVIVRRNGVVIDTINMTLDYDRVLEKGDVVIVLRGPERLVVHVAGAVVKPGPYPWVEGMRLTAALELAGGVLGGLKNPVITFIREVDGRPVKQRFTMQDLYSRKFANPILQPSDRIEIDLPKLKAGG